MPKIFLTGGHLTPALAVISELQKRPEWQIFFLGRRHAYEGSKLPSVEYQLLSERTDLKFLNLPTGRLQGRLTRYTLPSLLLVGVGLVKSFSYLRKYRPDVVLTFGSYMSFPVALSAWALHIPVLTHEQTMSPGLATRFVANLSRLVLVSWPKSLTDFRPGKAVLTGNPQRPEIFQIQPTATYREFQKIQIKSKLPTLLVMGGNQGSHPLNSALFSSLSALLQNHLVIHALGQWEMDKIERDKVLQTLTPTLKERYFGFDYLGPTDIGWALNESQLVLSRSGANTVSDLAALGKVAILVPAPWSRGNEQLHNARLLEPFGSTVLQQKDLTRENLLKQIQDLEKNQQPRSKLALKASAALLPPDAAANIVSQVEKVLSLSSA